ncbi:unnamed protein product, partial [Nesidiocoris tenuis]
MAGSLKPFYCACAAPLPPTFCRQNPSGNHSIRRISSRSRTVDFGFSITTSRFPRFIEAKERTDIPRKLRRGRACGSTSTRPVKPKKHYRSVAKKNSKIRSEAKFRRGSSSGPLDPLPTTCTRVEG